MEIQTIKIPESERELLFQFYGEDLGNEIDFNRLMPVVEKIEKNGAVIDISFDIRTRCTILIVTKFVLKKKIYFEDNIAIKATLKAVVEFIKWHNQHGK